MADKKWVRLSKRWVGSAVNTCDLCGKTLEDAFIDGKMDYGTWAKMCPACHRRWGMGLGDGKGQKYVRISLMNEWMQEV
jgi:hypothetical protein